ncbi:TPA: disulfide bond formation protein B [Clostridioides difficile]
MKKILLSQVLFSLICSFYIDIILNIPPCILCWIQRGIIIVILISLFLEKIFSAKVVYIISILGIIISFCHIMIQTFNINPSVCSYTKNSCENIEFELFGFLTLPILSFLNFIIILALSFLKNKVKKNN